ncbi:type VI secretion system Vgr family protein [Nannocystis bainbridge]|uniref:Type VI secretion system tip protein VgrG n=1 Tax=Nannocystis bainbridge TaxID=2995303 RepID=A0ABT5DTE9_9BACT|nr:type VI secretion system tip protein VgrG [Nannocystis bainbridge]MDC0716811.1 type VI secretion system tip protein VgrG [Nannocystis bainbridge]
MAALASILALIGNRPVYTFNVDGLDAEARVLRFTGQEGVSALFEFRLELACPHMLEVDQLVGKTGVLEIAGVDEPRFVHGIVAHAEYIGESREFALFAVTLVPRVWRLSLRQDCRIFQEQRTPDIIRAVLEVAGFKPSAYRFDIVASYAPRNYCVQYRESDWDFISRLLEEDGLFYYFEHEEDKHVLVMSDHKGTHRPIAGDPEVWWNSQDGHVEDREHIHEFRFGQHIRSGKASLRDFYFPTPDQGMEVRSEAKHDTDLEVYDYPGEYRFPGGNDPDRGPGIAKNRIEALQATRRSGTGKGDCMRLVPGYAFTLANHRRSELNGEYTLLTVQHRGEQPQVLDQDANSGNAFVYESRFTCIERAVIYRPTRATPRPFVRGLQSAVVVGPPGEEVHVDEQARVMVQFHWDRQGRFDDHSSCWIRVSQLWAGAGWGAMFIPRVGHEVLVDFLEGDPDKPIITGRVYHGNNNIPYPLPAEKTKSTIKSESSLGGGGYNEFRYEDLKGSEQIFMHAERDLDIHVNHDRMENVLHDRHLRVGDAVNGEKVGDFNELVMRDRHVRVDRHRHEHIGGDAFVHVGGIDGDGNQHVIIDKHQYTLVRVDRHDHVEGSAMAKVDKTTSLTIGDEAHLKVGSKTAIESGAEIHVKAPTIVIEAGTGITVKGPGGFITIDASGVVIQGRLVKVNSGGAALAGSGCAPIAPEDARPAEPQSPKPADRGAET